MRLYEKNTNKVAIYLRLSRDDGDKVESDSIGNQRELITEYIHTHKELQLVDEYADDGYSGTSFERPAFQRMIDDAKRKKVNCIIVKDLSRLGRNYIETGRYLEKIFPLLGIRFISVTDHYDSADESNDTDQIIIPFKNLINDAYCRDISIKIRSQLDVKRKNGKFIGSFAGYGYLKDSKDKNHLVIDDYAAEIVRLVFAMKIDGYSSQHIADRLNEMNVLPPLEYKRSCGFKFNGGFRSADKPAWNVVSVNRILKNEQYTGAMVQGKNRKINYKVKKSNPVDKSAWIRVAATHEAIIPPEIFQSVQELMKRDTRTAPDEKNVFVLSGFLRCGACGQNMVRRCTCKNGKRYYYFHCSTYKNGDGRSSHIISESKLTSCVLKTIQQQIATLVEAENIIHKMDQLPQEQFGIKSLTAQLVALKSEAERYKSIKAKLYEDMLESVVSKEEYYDINARFNTKLSDVISASEKLEKRRTKLLSGTTILRPWMATFKQYGNIQELDRKVLVALVDYITVYGKDRVEVCFRYREEIEELLEWADEKSACENKKEGAKVG